jgi:hypothetical protein
MLTLFQIGGSACRSLGSDKIFPRTFDLILTGDITVAVCGLFEDLYTGILNV